MFFGTGQLLGPTAYLGQNAPSGSWNGLLTMQREPAAAFEGSCPNDGEPYRTGPAGILYCPFDGYRPGR